MNSIIKNIFDKLKIKNKKEKQYVIECLNEKIKYYLDVRNKCNRFNLKIIIDEHIDLINKAIDKVKKHY